MAWIASETVHTFLQSIGLPNYDNRFSSQGYGTFIDVALLDAQDLDELNILKSEERDAILNAVENLHVEKWLEHYALQPYLDGFLSENITTLKDLKHMTVTDELVENLEIMVPGHRKRFMTAVQILQSPRARRSVPATNVEVELLAALHPDTVALGYWDQSKQLEPTACKVFLFVKGFLKGGQEDSSVSEALEFLVDSGSEVVTAQQEIIERLNLEFIGTIESRGVHASAEKPIYKGCIKLGKSHWFEVEVMPDYYESVGTSVLREFNHIINGRFHQWTRREETCTGCPEVKETQTTRKEDACEEGQEGEGSRGETEETRAEGQETRQEYTREQQKTMTGSHMELQQDDAREEGEAQSIIDDKDRS